MRRVHFVSVALVGFGGYLLLGGLLVMAPGPPRLYEGHVTDEPVAAWLWWLGASCVAVGLVMFQVSHKAILACGDVPLPRRPIGFLPLVAGVVPPAGLGAALVWLATPQSDLRSRTWLMFGAALVCVGAGGIAGIADRRRRTRSAT